MIKKVKITNYTNDSITLELARPDKTGIAIKSITGLGPTKSNINITEIITSDGGIFNSSRIESRNVVFNLQFLWNPTIEDVRHLTYKYFPVKREVTMLFTTDTRELELTGYVESNEPNIFSSDEGCQISIICPDPFFYEKGKSVENFSGVYPNFYFPFHNDHLTQKKIYFGEIYDVGSTIITYDGDSETGLTIEIHALGPATNISIRNDSSDSTINIDTDKLAELMGSGITAGDTITINTNRGKKQITLLRNGSRTNILNSLDRNMEWIQLIKGDNTFYFSAESGGSNLQYKLTYKTVYEGL